MKNNNFKTLGLPNALALLFVSIMLIATTKLHSQCVDCDTLSTTEGTYSSALGTNNHANGNFSFVGGENAKADGRSSFSFGRSTNVYENYALGIGRYLEVYGSSSLAIGRFLRTLSPDAMVIGYGFSESQTLDNNVNRSLIIGFESTKPTLFVGPSNGVNNTGRIGIGNVTDPQAKLHIRGDAAEDADLLLEPGAGNKTALIRLGQNNSISARDGGDMHFETETGQAFVFENGNMGIGTSQPEAKLHVLGDFQVGSQQDPQDIRLHGSINASGNLATAFGYGNNASGAGSTVIGFNSEANKQGSIAIGKDLVVSREYSIVIGSGKDETRQLINNTPQSLMIGFNSEYPTFFVSQPQAGYITGRIGIGNVTFPQAKLHIRADEDEHASLKLEATGTGKQAMIHFTENHQISASADNAMHLHSAQGKGFVFHDGDIYLHDIHSGIIMKSPNGQCWRGRLSDNGSLSFEQTTCPEDMSSALQEQPLIPGQLKIYPNPTGDKLTIVSDLNGQNAEVLISTVKGSMISRLRIVSNHMEISLNHFVAGTYLLSLEINGQIIETQKIIKQ